MLSNACLLAKFGFDTAENEPAKNLLILLSRTKLQDTAPGDSGLGAPLGEGTRDVCEKEEK